MQIYLVTCLLMCLTGHSFNTHASDRMRREKDDIFDGNLMDSPKYSDMTFLESETETEETEETETDRISFKASIDDVPNFRTIQRNPPLVCPYFYEPFDPQQYKRNINYPVMPSSSSLNPIILYTKDGEVVPDSSIQPTEYIICILTRYKPRVQPKVQNVGENANREVLFRNSRPKVDSGPSLNTNRGAVHPGRSDARRLPELRVVVHTNRRDFVPNPSFIVNYHLYQPNHAVMPMRK